MEWIQASGIAAKMIDGHASKDGGNQELIGQAVALVKMTTHAHLAIPPDSAASPIPTAIRLDGNFGQEAIEEVRMKLHRKTTPFGARRPGVQASRLLFSSSPLYHIGGAHA